jgi:L-alanine-DL-glutamate epimerase-like enolase superfamily enzyme
MNRRVFLQHATIIGAGLSFTNSTLAQSADQASPAPAPFRIHEFLKEPIVIKSVSLLQWKKNFFVVVTDTNGQKGMTLCNARIEFLSGIFNGLVAPFFMNKDARLVEQLVDDVYKEERNYKFSGMPFWNCVGHIEVAIWDLLGKLAGKPVHVLLGTKIRSALPMYLSSLTRENSAAEEVNKILSAIEATGCNAVKVKVGGRMGNDAQSASRSYDIVKLLRSKLPSSFTIYADANSSFDVKEGIRMGKFLEEQGVDIYEEPCPWEDFESSRKVNSALKKIKIAGGEQDTSFYRFEWYCKNNGLDVLQPDTFYNGGIVRTLRVAQLCKQYHKHFAPHSPKADPLEAPFLHLMSVAPNVYGFQEFPLSGVGKKQESWWGPHYALKNGILNIPDTAGMGIEYDDTIFKETVKF